MTSRGRLLLNAGLFQLGWLACIFGAQRPLWLLLAGLCLAVQLLWVSDNAGKDARLVLRIAAFGWLLDSTLMYLGVFQFGHHQVLPFWLLLLWLLFASTLRYSLQWTAHRWWLSSLIGAICGPLSYLAGASLADVSLPLGRPLTLTLLALIWALLLPTLHCLAGTTRPCLRLLSKK